MMYFRKINEDQEMVKVSEVKKGDTLIYDKSFKVTFLRVEGDKVIIKDPVLGELKVLVDIFEKHYSFID